MIHSLHHLPLPDQRFYHRNKKYRLSSAGGGTLALLKDISLSPSCQSTRGLLMARPRIRAALSVPTPVVICRVIDTTDCPRVLRIGIWMLGRIGDPYGTKSVVPHVDHPMFAVRREAIRSLQRLHAWPELRRIALQHEDPRIRRLAEPNSPTPYPQRLAKYVAAGTVLQSAHAAHPLVIDPHVDLGEGRPPKSGWRIAAVLRRIHLLVRKTRRKQRMFAITQNRLRCRPH